MTVKYVDPDYPEDTCYYTVENGWVFFNYGSDHHLSTSYLTEQELLDDGYVREEDYDGIPGMA